MVYNNDEGEARSNISGLPTLMRQPTPFMSSSPIPWQKTSRHLRYESFDIDYADPYFKDLGRHGRRQHWGVRYDIVDRSAIKAQVRRDGSRRKHL